MVEATFPVVESMWLVAGGGGNAPPPPEKTMCYVYLKNVPTVAKTIYSLYFDLYNNYDVAFL